MKILSDEQYKMKKAAEAKKFFAMESIEGQKVGHMDKDVLISFMRENGYKLLDMSKIAGSKGWEMEGWEFSNGSIRLAMNGDGILKRVSGKQGGFNFLSHLAAKSSAPVTTEKQLGAKDDQGPDDITEKQIDKVRKDDEQEITTEKRLEKVRTAGSDSHGTAVVTYTDKDGKTGEWGIGCMEQNSTVEKLKSHWDKYFTPKGMKMISVRFVPANKKESGFNMKAYLSKQSHYEGVQGYMVAQTRAWQNCVKCKQDAGKTAQEAWQDCINEYGGKKSNEEWGYEYASDVNDKIKKKASSDSCPCVTEKQLGAKDDQGPETLTENQIDKDRHECEEVTTEKRLEKVRKEACSTTEKQLSDKWKKEVVTITENQIDKDHKDEEEITTEKRLEKVRKEAQSLKGFDKAEKAYERQIPDDTEDPDNDSKDDEDEDDEPKERVEKKRASSKSGVKEAGNSAGHCPECGSLHGRTNNDNCQGDLRCDECKKKKKQKVAGILSTPVPKPGQFGLGLNEEAMKMLKQYDIYPNDLYEYDDPSSHHKEIYTGIQAAKQGNNAALQQALESTFGKNKPWQKNLSAIPEIKKEAQVDTPHLNRVGKEGEQGLCPVCGKGVSIIDQTLDGRLIGDCKDAFTLDQWKATDDGSGAPGAPLGSQAQAAQAQMGLYWERIRQKQQEGLTPGQAVMAVLSEMQKDGDKIVVQAQASDGMGDKVENFFSPCITLKRQKMGGKPIQGYWYVDLVKDLPLARQFINEAGIKSGVGTKISDQDLDVFELAAGKHGYSVETIGE